MKLREQLVWPPPLEVVVAPLVLDHLQERQGEPERTKTRAKSSRKRGVVPRQPFLLLVVMSFLSLIVLRST